MSARKFSEYGGYIAGVVLIAFGVVAIIMGVNGRNEVRDQLAAQKITAGADAPEITNGALKEGELIATGAQAREFAKIMEFHTLDSTGGKRYAEMGRFLTPGGKDTNDEAAAAKTEDGRPVENGLRNLWVTETALTTALNMSFMAEQVALFGLVVGVALLLTGVGFIVIAIAGALRAPRTDQAAATTSAKVAAA